MRVGHACMAGMHACMHACIRMYHKRTPSDDARCSLVIAGVHVIVIALAYGSLNSLPDGTRNLPW